MSEEGAYSFVDGVNVKNDPIIKSIVDHRLQGKLEPMGSHL